jgi:hypothetical protein
MPHLPNDIWGSVQIMKLIIVQLPPYISFTKYLPHCVSFAGGLLNCNRC